MGVSSGLFSLCERVIDRRRAPKVDSRDSGVPRVRVGVTVARCGCGPRGRCRPRVACGRLPCVGGGVNHKPTLRRERASLRDFCASPGAPTRACNTAALREPHISSPADASQMAAPALGVHSKQNLNT
eukprot:scaffold17838_cov55-Phaeocystis_antarctica.AAC.1